MQEFDEGNKKDAERMRSEGFKQLGVRYEIPSGKEGCCQKEGKKSFMSYCRFNDMWIRTIDEHCPQCKKYVGDKIIHGPKPFFERLRGWLSF